MTQNGMAIGKCQVTDKVITEVEMRATCFILSFGGEGGV